MTWKEFKTWVESKGVTDEHNISYIDIASNRGTESMCMYIADTNKRVSIEN
jgi:hypothetical protein